jgi:hypothetical protein
MKSTPLLSLTFAITLAFPVIASAGEKAGNGGGAQLCYTDASMKVEKSITSYDLHQGRKVLRLNIPEWDGVESKYEILFRVLSKIHARQPEIAKLMANVVHDLNEPGFVTDNDRIDLQTVPILTPVLDENCTYKQIIVWYDPGQYSLEMNDIVLRDNTHYRTGKVHMDPLNRAALDIHEAAYKVARNLAHHQYAETADHVRDILVFVAEAFSTEPIAHPLPIVDPLNPLGFYDPANSWWDRGLYWLGAGGTRR